MEEENIFLYLPPPAFLLLLIRSQLVWHSQTSIFQFQMIPYQKVNKNPFQVNPQTKACQNNSLHHNIYNCHLKKIATLISL